ncbi:MAG: hypothetical protein ABSH30_04940 [Acidimicrobiales bacterium]|jgi:hypothetical protein
MLETPAILYLFELLTSRLATVRSAPDRGDVAEKIVIVGVFVALAILVGAIITHAVHTDATNIAKQISGAP